MASALPPHGSVDRFNSHSHSLLNRPERSGSGKRRSLSPVSDTRSARGVDPMEEPRRRPSNEQLPLLDPANAATTNVNRNRNRNRNSSSGNNNNHSSTSTSVNSINNENGRADGIGDDRGRGPDRHGLHHPDDSQETKSLWFLTVLTIGIAGLQIAWSVEMSNGSPYLLGLGLSKSLMALVWIAGPLTGTLVQPYVGMLSDGCRLPWGKRKPFILGGTVATIISLMFLAWAKEIVGGTLGLFGADPESGGVRVAVIVVAVIGIYVLDFAINTVQASLRAFIVDCGPAHQQEAANSMASRMTGIGNILGFVAGYVNLTGPLSFLGDTQFKILCVLASIALAASVVFSSAVIKERDPRLEGPPPKNRRGVASFFATIFKSIRRLPPQIMRVCQVQFCGWVGFFPLLFYTSSYIGEIYVQPFLEADPHMSPEDVDRLYEEATRIGSFALLVNSVVSLLTNVFLPFFVAPTYDSHLADGSSSSGAQPALLDRLRIPGFTLKRAWFGSLILFAVVMVSTLFVRSVNGAITLIGLAGITWAITLWAPYAIISAEVSRRNAMARAGQISPAAAGSSAYAGGTEEPEEGGEAEAEEEERADQAGVIMGIHNMSISAPQILANVGSSLIFKLWQKPRGTPGDRSIAIVLAIGGLFAFASAFFVLRVRDDLAAPEDVGDQEAGRSGGGPRTKRGYQQVPTSDGRGRNRRSGSFGGLEIASGSDS